MADLPSLPLFVDDYEAATAHLSLEEDGAYNRLLRLCWRQSDCSISADDGWIMRHLRVSSRDYERVIKPILKEFFTRTRSRWVQKRLRQEHAYVSAVSSARRAAGRKGGTAKAQKTKQMETSKAKLLPEQNDSSALAPTPTPTPTYSVDTNVSTAADAAQDPQRLMFDIGLRLLEASGVAERRARELLGKWSKSHGHGAVIDALSRCQREAPPEPVGFIEGALRFGQRRQRESAPQDGDERTLPSGQLQRFSAFDGWLNVYG